MPVRYPRFGSIGAKPARLVFSMVDGVLQYHKSHCRVDNWNMMWGCTPTSSRSENYRCFDKLEAIKTGVHYRVILV